MLDSVKVKIGIIVAMTGLTLGIHYGWVLEPIFGDAHWIHAVHGRFCYIPIVIGASWFGLRGGLYSAMIISILVLPLLFGSPLTEHNLAGELVEIVFYFAIAILTGGLVDREFGLRRHQEKMRLRLERSHQLSKVGQIAAGVAHEIKNPLASIKGAAEIISDEKTSSEEKKEFQEIMIKEIRRLDGTVADFLAYARPREIKLARLNFSESVNHCVRQLVPQAEKNSITLKPLIDHDLFIEADRSRIHEMILNIILNAIEASSEDNVIEISLTSPATDEVVLTVTDEGAGIEKEALDKIFEPFYTTKMDGTGLGLAMAKDIIEVHNGEVSINSKLGAGTTVRVMLPNQKESDRS